MAYHPYWEPVGPGGETPKALKNQFSPDAIGVVFTPEVSKCQPPST